jgi:MSHA biogenesis protein MshO
MRAPSRNAGFSLIELVVTLVISTIVVSFVSMFISGPVQGFMDQSRRAALVDAADAAVQRLNRDVRRALPNSVRTTTNALLGIVALELLGTVDGSRYRAQPPGGPNEILDFASADDEFDVLGPFTQVEKPFSSTEFYLAIYNVGVTGADAYEPSSTVITPLNTQIGIAAGAAPGVDHVTLGLPFRFGYASPTQRVYLVDGPVSYLCDSINGTLTRYENYPIELDQSRIDSHAELLAAGAVASLMANQLTACAFNYSPGTSARAGLVTLEITVSSQGEAVALLSQVHVDNVP